MWQREKSLWTWQFAAQSTGDLIYLWNEWSLAANEWFWNVSQTCYRQIAANGKTSSNPLHMISIQLKSWYSLNHSRANWILWSLHWPCFQAADWCLKKSNSISYISSHPCSYPGSLQAQQSGLMPSAGSNLLFSLHLPAAWWVHLVNQSDRSIQLILFCATISSYFKIFIWFKC